MLNYLWSCFKVSIESILYPRLWWSLKRFWATSDLFNLWTSTVICSQAPPVIYLSYTYDLLNLYWIGFTSNLQEVLNHLWSFQPLDLHCDLLSSTSWNGGAEGNREERPLGEHFLNLIKSTNFWSGFLSDQQIYLKNLQIFKLLFRSTTFFILGITVICMPQIIALLFFQSIKFFIRIHLWEWALNPTFFNLVQSFSGWMLFDFYHFAQLLTWSCILYINAILPHMYTQQIQRSFSLSFRLLLILFSSAADVG